tara:strand:+ start:1410 stop:1967 length:558 start_codon:yes stop_codon:yes gene_type:complete
MKRKILVIGAGGIGSYLISFLDNLDLYEIQVNDDDKVETKNLTYQNFSEEEVGKNKSVAMGKHKCVSISSPYPILTPQQLEGFDLVVCCVDNLSTRRMLYNSNIKWLDLRSQGRNAAYVSYEADPSMYDSLLAGKDGSYSCQGESWDGSQEGIHFMHMAIAAMGAQWIQRWFSGDGVNSFAIINV